MTTLHALDHEVRRLHDLAQAAEVLYLSKRDTATLEALWDARREWLAMAAHVDALKLKAKGGAA